MKQLVMMLDIVEVMIIQWITKSVKCLNMLRATVASKLDIRLLIVNTKRNARFNDATNFIIQTCIHEKTCRTCMIDNVKPNLLSRQMVRYRKEVIQIDRMLTFLQKKAVSNSQQKRRQSTYIFLRIVIQLHCYALLKLTLKAKQ